jgi:hypothetical protein
MDLINAYRVSIGLNSFNKKQLYFPAEEHNNYMIATIRLVMMVLMPISRYMNILSYISIENVADVYKPTSRVLKCLLNSLAHKKNIVGNFTSFWNFNRENTVTAIIPNIFAKNINLFFLN